MFNKLWVINRENIEKFSDKAKKVIHFFQRCEVKEISLEKN